MKRPELFPPAERCKVIAKLREYGRSIPQASTSRCLSQNVADVLGVTCPEVIQDQVRMMLSFAAQPARSVAAGIEVKPWKPLVLSQEMQRALHRAEHPYEQFAGDGR